MVNVMIFYISFTVSHAFLVTHKIFPKIDFWAGNSTLKIYSPSVLSARTKIEALSFSNGFTNNSPTPEYIYVINPCALHQVIKLPIASYRIPIF